MVASIEIPTLLPMPTKTFLCCWGLCVVVIFFSACAPLVPLSYNANIPEDPLYLGIETEEATVFLQYTESKHHHYIFDLQVINNSSSALSIAPQLISYYASSTTFKPLDSLVDVHKLSEPNSSLFMKRQFANSADETKRLFRKKKESTLSGAGILLGLLAVGLAVYDAEKDKEDSEKETLSRREKNEDIARDIVVAVAQTASEAAFEVSKEEREEEFIVPYKLFAESTILASDSVRGQIFLPKQSFEYQRIVVPVGSYDYVFDFRKASNNPNQSRLPHRPSVDAQRK
jgi:hypothetical protein